MRFFVTGGSRGIGAAIVLAAARAGHDVAFTFVKAEEEAARVLAKAQAIAPEARFSSFQLDVRDAESVESVADQVLEQMDGIDVVVANAGVSINGMAASMDDEDFKTVIDTNLTGAFYVVRQFLPPMLKKRFGRIILVSSLAAFGASGQIAYGASKAALIGMAATLGKEYGRRGITANAVVPGFIETDMTREGMSEQNRSFWMEYCPARRVGSPEEVAATVLHLAGEQAGFINGETIRIDGGLSWAP